MSFIVQPQVLLAIGPKRQFGGNSTAPNTSNPANGNGSQPVFSGYVTITENSIDSITITQQPVQQGAKIADHAFKNPGTLTIQILMPSTIGQSLQTIYANLLKLQSSFQPFNVSTPKRVYGNMLIATLGVTTEKKTENILAVNVQFQEIITVPIGVTTLNRAQLGNPGSNGGTQSAGAKTLQSQSALSSIKQAITGVL